MKVIQIVGNNSGIVFLANDFYKARTRIGEKVTVVTEATKHDPKVVTKKPLFELELLFNNGGYEDLYFDDEEKMYQALDCLHCDLTSVKDD